MSMVYRSKIAEVLRERRMGVSELRRRLLAKGAHCSRGALDHLVSDRPVKQVDLRILWPVLDELELDMRSAFAAAPDDGEAAGVRRDAAQRVARQAATAIRTGAILEGEQEQDGIIAHLTEQVRIEHPEVFDRRGRLRKRALARLLVKELGTEALTGDEFLRLGGMAATEPRATP